jgi:hypothetical protein
VDVVGHDHKFVDVHTGVKRRYFTPHGLNHAPSVVQAHFPIHHLAEHTGAILRDDGDKIRASLGIIISFQTDAAAVVLFRIVVHNPNSFRNRFAEPTRGCLICGRTKECFIQLSTVFVWYKST